VHDPLCEANRSAIVSVTGKPSHEETSGLGIVRVDSKSDERRIIQIELGWCFRENLGNGLERIGYIHRWDVGEHVSCEVGFLVRQQKHGGEPGVPTPDGLIGFRHPKKHLCCPHPIARGGKPEGVSTQGLLKLRVGRASPTRTCAQSCEIDLGDVEIGDDPE